MGYLRKRDPPEPVPAIKRERGIEDPIFLTDGTFVLRLANWENSGNLRVVAMLRQRCYANHFGK